MKALARLVLLSVALATMLDASTAGAQSPAKPPASPVSRPGVTPSLAKSCMATYDPAPGAPWMHFNVSTTCGAPPSAPDGASCGCPVYAGGRSLVAKGKVFTSKPGPAPVIH